MVKRRGKINIRVVLVAVAVAVAEAVAVAVAVAVEVVVVVVETLLPCHNLLLWEISHTNVAIQITIDNIIDKEILPTEF